MNWQLLKPTGFVPWAFVLLIAAAPALCAEPPTIEYDAKAKAIAVRGVPADILTRWRKQPPDDWTKILAVYVGSSKTPMLGKHSADETALHFVPRFPLERGLKYKVVFQVGDQKPVERAILLPKVISPKEVVTHVYPSGDRLPENQLKFYLHFSGPMRRGEAYTRVSLIDDKGKKVDRPFLELGEELWDPSGLRFTLFLHPGRIKRGLKPREELGPPLVEGHKYSLVVEKEWLDADGNPLKSEFRKSFTVGKPDEDQPSPKLWKLTSPSAGSKAALVVQFPEPLEHALLQRMLWIVDANKNRIAGTIETAKNETEWRFTPTKTWPVGDHRLVIDTELEDLAGNSVARPFEVDEFRKVDEKVELKTVELRFTVK